MKKRIIEFDKQNIGLSEETLVARSKESKNSLNKKLVTEFLNYANAKYILPLNNFTSALHLSMCACNLKRGDKVICSVNSSPAVPEVIRHFDAEPIFIDIEPNSFAMNLQHLKEFLESNRSKKIKAIIIAHTDGELFHISQIKKIIGSRNILIIEDGSNTLGLDREKLDSVSDIRLFSLDNTLSNFAIFTTDREDLYETAKLLSNHGLKYEDEQSVDYIYDIIDEGCYYQPSKLETMFAISTLEVLSNHLLIRRSIAKTYISNFVNIPHIYMQEFKQNHTYSQFIIKIDKNRDGFAHELKERGIETKLQYIPLHLLSYYKNKYLFKINSFPNALKNFQQILSLPIHSALSSEDVAHIIESVITVAKNRI